MLSARIRVDLSRPQLLDGENGDRHALRDVHLAPDGAELVVYVGDRAFDVGAPAVWLLREHLDRLHVRIEGRSVLAVQHWYAAIASGDCSPAGWGS